MKDLTPSVWEGFVATHRPGDVVKGKVSRFTNFGIFVELGEGLEGLCHISELSDERVENAESVAQLGQEMDFKILRIEAADQKIGLSHRAVGKEDEPVVDTKMYSSEAKGGMASLGELANLKFGTTAEEAPTPEDAEEKKKAKKAAKQAKAEVFAAKEAETPAETVVAETPAEEVVAEAPAAETTAEVEDAPVSEVVAEEIPAPQAPEEETSQPTDETVSVDTSEVPAEAEAEPAPVAEKEETADEQPVEETAASETVEEPVAESHGISEAPVVEEPQAAEASATDDTPKATKKKSAKRQN